MKMYLSCSTFYTQISVNKMGCGLAERPPPSHYFVVCGIIYYETNKRVMELLKIYELWLLSSFYHLSRSIGMFIQRFVKYLVQMGDGGGIHLALPSPVIELREQASDIPNKIHALF